MALFAKKQRERTIYFPWERRGIGRALSLPRRRATVWVLLALVGAALWWIGTKERDRRLERMTRATVQRARSAVDAYRGDHAGRCPRDLAELVIVGDRPAYLPSVPLDAWKRPLRYVCPGRDAARPYDLLSDGPDGEPYGRDRIE